MAEFELSRLKERQSEGIAKAREKGVYTCRTINSVESEEVFLNKAKSQTIIRHLNKGETVRRTALLSKLSINTVRKVQRLIKTEV